MACAARHVPSPLSVIAGRGRSGVLSHFLTCRQPFTAEHSISPGTASHARDDALARPLAAEFDQGFLAQKVLRHLEEDAVFKIEFLPRQMHHIQQPALRFLARAHMAHLLQALTDGVVLVVDLLQLADLIEPGSSPLKSNSSSSAA